jgi:flagellar hook-basal body complex protein FliE
MPSAILGSTISGASRSSLGRGLKAAAAGATGAAGGGEAFAESLGKLIDGVEDSQTEANTAITNMVENNGEVHDTMIALQRAEMSLQLTVQIRNKLVQAYQDVMRMPI